MRYPTKQKVIKKVTIQEYEQLTNEDILKARREQEESAFNPYSKELMKEYLDNQMKNRASLNSSNLPLNSKNDLLMGLSAVAYSIENGYEITSSDEYIEINNMLLRSFDIRRDTK